MKPEAAADEAEKLLGNGFRAVKLRLGHATLAQDLAVTRAVRKRIADELEIFVDYNQALDVPEALKRGAALQSEGVAWLEEPIAHYDLAGCAQISRDLDLAVQIGENFDGPNGLLQALQSSACDLVMPDYARIGGVSGLDACRRNCGRLWHPDVVAPASRSKRSIARSDANRTLARIR
jgi:mandelate racemase